MDCKRGEVAEFEYAGTKLKVAPLPFRRFQKAMAVVAEILKEAEAEGQKPDFMKVAPELVEKYFGRLYEFIVDGAGDRPTLDWTLENLTMPQIGNLVQAAMIVNGVSDFLTMVRARQAPR